jgi:hypothetical protein
VANEYVTLALFKNAITMNGAVVDRDDLLQLALDTAHEDVNEHCGRRFYLDPAVSARTFRLQERVVYCRDGQQLVVDDIGDPAGLIVEVGSGTSWTVQTSLVEATPENAIAQGKAITGLLMAASYWPIDPFTRVRVTAKWGWPVVPNKVRQATLIQAVRLFKRKDSPEGILGSAEWGAVRLSRVDPDVEALLAHFVLPGFG